MPGNDLPKDDRIDKLLEESMRANTQIRDFDIRIKECSTKIEKLEKAEQPNRQEVNKLTDQMIELTQEREKLKTSFAESMVRLEQIEAKIKSENEKGKLNEQALTDSKVRLAEVEARANSAKKKGMHLENEIQAVKASIEEQKLGLLVLKNARENIDREREVDTKLKDLTQQMENLRQQSKLREEELQTKIIDLTEECKSKSSSMASMLQQVEQCKTEVAVTKELLEKLIETKKQNENKIEALETVANGHVKEIQALQTTASGHLKEIDKLRRSMIQNSQVNLRYETFNTHLKDSLRELTELVDRELSSLSEHIRVLYQELHSIQSQLVHQTTSHTVQMTDFTKYSQTPGSLMRRHSFPVIPTLHEETPLKLTTSTSQEVLKLPPLTSLPTSTSVSTTITPRKRPQSVKVHTIEPHAETMSHTTSVQHRMIRRKSYPSMTPSHTKK